MPMFDDIVRYASISNKLLMMTILLLTKETIKDGF
jgi:hypothetical protein